MNQNRISSKYNISLKNERDFWNNKVFNNRIKLDYKCTLCNQISLKLKKLNSTSNPYKYQCNELNIER